MEASPRASSSSSRFAAASSKPLREGAGAARQKKRDEVEKGKSRGGRHKAGQRIINDCPPPSGVNRFSFAGGGSCCRVCAYISRKGLSTTTDGVLCFLPPPGLQSLVMLLSACCLRHVQLRNLEHKSYVQKYLSRPRRLW